MNDNPTNKFVARIREHDSKMQTLEEHLLCVASLTEKFAEKIGMPSCGRLIGLMHDFGKYSAAFQHYIRAVTGQLGVEEKDKAESLQGKIDHATAGAQRLWEDLSARGDGISIISAQLLAASVASHHTGLYDFIDLKGASPFLERLTKDKSKTYLSEAIENCENSIRQEYRKIFASGTLLNEVETAFRKITSYHENPNNPIPLYFHYGLLLRCLFSCLIDGDRLNSANFESPDPAQERNTNTLMDWNPLVKDFETHLNAFKSETEMGRLRNAISDYCLTASCRSKGLFTLTVPTGGGKTLASLRFALHHARRHSLDRIIYVVPYTSIIEQNAEAVRQILGSDQVLEHHSNLVPEKDTWLYRQLSENWDAPIVFTTSVQFLNALFSSSTRDVRRMHQLANAVIIFDEIQTLPIKTVHLFNNAMNFLTQTCGSSVVLCTATQPQLSSVDEKKGHIHPCSITHIIQQEEELFQKLRRTEVKNCCKAEGWSIDEIANITLEQAKEHGSTLVIVNTKSSAKKLYDAVKDNADFVIYHLSTNMCPAHRKNVLDTVRGSLSSCSKPIICISTQLIEAGVDIDFGSVIRYLAGLDSIAQAAGRCNRHGSRKGLSPVLVVNPKDESLNNLPDIKEGAEKAMRVLREFIKNPASLDHDLLSPMAIKRFYQYYFHDRSEEMIYKIRQSEKVDCDSDLLSLLSTNVLGIKAHERVNPQPPKLFLRQAFKTAFENFKVIDAATEGVIVPYGEGGRQVIHELRATLSHPGSTLKERKRLLRKAQQYSVNLFPNDLNKLKAQKCIHTISHNFEIYTLDERHYSDVLGITLEESNGMAFLNV